MHDLLHLTSDPRVKQRLMEADADNDGRISRKDILKVMHSEMSAKQRLKWGLISGGILLVFCLLMLAANAALTYTVVRMSQETTVQSSGVMTDKAGNNIIGAGVGAGVGWAGLGTEAWPLQPLPAACLLLPWMPPRLMWLRPGIPAPASSNLQAPPPRRAWWTCSTLTTVQQRPRPRCSASSPWS